MIKVGKKQPLIVVMQTLRGFILEEEGSTTYDEVLLLKENAPEGLEVDDEVEVFVYKISDGTLMATFDKPESETGMIGLFEVGKTRDFGAFLKWGKEKDLFLPRDEQSGIIQEGREIIAGVMEEEDGNVIATMHVAKVLSDDSPYAVDDVVEGMVYRINEDYGVFVAVDNKYDSMIPNNEIHEKYFVGDKITARVTSIRDDGKLNLAVRKKAHLQMGDDADRILQMLDENNGFLPFDDKSDPEAIKKTFKMSKKGFKRATGRLYKERKITFVDNGIEKL